MHDKVRVQDKILRYLRLLGSHQQWLMVLIDWKVSMMKIVRSTSSCALAGESNETREAVRSGEIQAKGVVLPDDDGESPNPERGELVSASLNNYRRPTFPRWRSQIDTETETERLSLFSLFAPVRVRKLASKMRSRFGNLFK